MNDPRIVELANKIVADSLNVQQSWNVWIETIDVPEVFATALIAATVDRGAIPFVDTRQSETLRQIYLQYNEEAYQRFGKSETQKMSSMQAHIFVDGSRNNRWMSDIPPQKTEWMGKYYRRPVREERLRRKWMYMKFPNSSMAQQAGMSTVAFEDFYFDVCGMDYKRLTAAMEPLRDYLLKADKVSIIGPDTELEFSIKDMPIVLCGGWNNLPDGEAFTAPVRKSANGKIRFNIPTIFQGVQFSDIMLEFRNGQIIDAHAGSATSTKQLNSILDLDEGARYLGEWGIGVNYNITRPMLDILFDEKMAGSIHLTPGNAYDDADNKNRSQIHWDMVMGGEGVDIFVDDDLFRKDGRFVPEYLHGLNPENLR